MLHITPSPFTTLSRPSEADLPRSRRLSVKGGERSGTSGEHREALARKNLRAWLDKDGLPYHSSHKFRHGHIQYGLARSRTIADYKAVSLNVMHASMEITDEIYSRLDEKEVRVRIEQLGQEKSITGNPSEDDFALFQEFLEWQKAKK